ncbi:MAG TPA: DNA internalization-related competence protein ComEC/Rec2 [Burkholderiales bacterium]
MRAAAIAFLGGVLAVQQLAALPSPLWAVVLVPALLLPLLHPRWLFVTFLVGGFLWAWWRAELILQQQLPEALEGRDLIVEGTVAELPQPAEYGTRFAFDVERAEAQGAPVSIPRRVRLSAEATVPVRAGDRWRFAVRLKRPHGLQNPGGFDYEAYLFRQRLRATGYVRAAPAPVHLGAATGLRYGIDRWRARLGERMRALMPQERFAGMLVALANGDTGGLSDEQWETLRRTGTLHLVAISGLHISLIAGAAYWLVRWLWALPAVTVLRLPAPLAGAIGGMVAATLYAALAGFVIPTQRALVMLAVAMGAVLLRRRAPPGKLLAAALLAVLVYDPLAVMASGFWLSFAAVAVIIYAMYGERAGSRLWRKWGYLQLAIAVGMLPLMLWLFQRVSLSAPAANFLAVPVFDLLVVPLTLLGALAVGFGIDSVAAWLFAAGAALLGWLWHALAFLAALEYGEWLQHRPPAWAFACALVGAALLLAPRGWPARAVGAIWMLPMFLVRPPAPAPGEAWFTLLDVGQGLAAVVRTAEHVLLYDTGPRWSARSDAGRTVVVPYLRSQGVARIDALVLSHGDSDHVGGTASVLADIDVARIISGAPGIAGEPCRGGEQWQWGGVRFTLLGPGAEAGESNDASCVLRVDTGHGSILLPGDIERNGERALIARAADRLAATVLVAPHHGSRSSSSPEFLARVGARYVLFAVGFRNPYRHPHPAVVGRYRALGAQLYDSPSAGALELRLRASGIEVQPYRERARRYWFAEPAPLSAP